MKRLLLFELNECNTELLREGADTLNLVHIRRLLQLRQCETTTEDRYDQGSLEPWVQWVSVHTGVPYDEHGIKHIGDVPSAAHPQIWQRLSSAGITSGIWGVLNGARNDASECHFFVPDPWTTSEDAYPHKLQGLVSLPRLLAKNRVELLQPGAIAAGLHLANAFKRPRHMASGLAQAARVARQMRHDHDKAYVYFTAFEYLSVQRFFEYKRTHDPQFSVLFINMLAHAQHYYWDERPLIDNPRMRYVLTYVDRVLGLVFDGLQPGEQLAVHNGMAQFSIAGKIKHLVYRQRDHASFLRLLNISHDTVDAHMTNDAHLFAHTPAALDAAYRALEAVTVSGEPLFTLERYADAPLKLFFQVRFGGELPAAATFESNGSSHPFWEHFEVLGTHTGRHGQSGTLFTTRPDLPPEGPNHGLHDWILRYFDVMFA